jgi:hypothetical protein
MNSEKEQKKRTYKNDEQFRHRWTMTDLEKFVTWYTNLTSRFKIGFAKFGNGPRSNRRIADFIGNGVHPSHVVYLKQVLRRKKRKIDDVGGSILEELNVEERSALDN